MSKIGTTGVWSCTSGELWRRPGSIKLAESRRFSRDVHEPIVVSEGLRDDDALVLLSIKGLLRRNVPVGGFLVYDVDTSTDAGAGLIIVDDALSKNPGQWVNDRIGNMWARLHANGFTLGEFDHDPDGLGRVDTYIDTHYGIAAN